MGIPSPLRGEFFGSRGGYPRSARTRGSVRPLTPHRSTSSGGVPTQAGSSQPHYALECSQPCAPTARGASQMAAARMATMRVSDGNSCPANSACDLRCPGKAALRAVPTLHHRLPPAPFHTVRTDEGGRRGRLQQAGGVALRAIPLYLRLRCSETKGATHATLPTEQQGARLQSR